jgi:hypothetical protein
MAHPPPPQIPPQSADPRRCLRRQPRRVDAVVSDAHHHLPNLSAQPRFDSPSPRRYRLAAAGYLSQRRRLDHVPLQTRRPSAARTLPGKARKPQRKRIGNRCVCAFRRRANGENQPPVGCTIVASAQGHSHIYRNFQFSIAQRSRIKRVLSREIVKAGSASIRTYTNPV